MRGRAARRGHFLFSRGHEAPNAGRMTAPMQTLFGTAGIDALAWGAVLTFGVLLFLLVEVEKALMRRWLHAGAAA